MISVTVSKHLFELLLHAEEEKERKALSLFLHFQNLDSCILRNQLVESAILHQVHFSHDHFFHRLEFPSVLKVGQSKTPSI